MAIPLTDKTISGRYAATTSRLFLLDYDGTLVDFAPTPLQAIPTPRLMHIIHMLTADPNNRVAIISGRDKRALHQWFGGLPVGLAAEHGQFVRMPGGGWRATAAVDHAQRQKALQIVTSGAAQLPHAFIEPKETSLVLHYRQSPPHLVGAQLPLLLESLKGFNVLPGNKVVEVRFSQSNKAHAMEHWLASPADFICIAGDDTTDEAMFAAAPPHAVTIKVGRGSTKARYRVATPAELLGLLEIV